MCIMLQVLWGFFLGSFLNFYTLISNRAMPDPLLTYALYDDFIEPAKAYDYQRQSSYMPIIMAAYSDILKKLPKPNYILARYFPS